MVDYTGDQAPIAAFKRWLAELGGTSGFHPDVDYAPDGTGGHFLRAVADLPPDSVICTLPFSAAITPSVARAALASACRDHDALDRLNERQVICTYLAMHWVLLGYTSPSYITGFQHGEYLATLPPPSSLRTPLHFNDAELEMLRGTNLYRASLDRKASWEAEYRECMIVLRGAAHEISLLDRLSWEYYVTAATYLSSRAFPSTLLSPSPTLVATPSSHPVLLPGIDSANHRRAARVSWVVGGAGPAPLTISLVTHDPVPAGEQIYNNYGAKPNSELVLGYGFAIPDNPDDTLVLRIGGGVRESSTHEVGRDARGAENVYTDVLQQVHAALEGRDESHHSWEEQLDAAEALVDMLQTSLEKIPDLSASNYSGDVRPEIHVMVSFYVDGQRDILEALLGFAELQLQQISTAAEEAGISFIQPD